MGGPRRLVAGRVHRRAPTPSTRSRSCRWRRGTSTAPAGCSTSAAARARSPGSRPAAAPPWSSASTRPPAQVAEAVRRGGGPAYARAGAGRAAVPVRRPSTRSSRASCSSTSDDVDDAIAEVARVLAPGRPVPLLPEPPAAPDAEQRLDRRPDPRPARAVLADRALPRRRTRPSRRWRRACSSPSSTGRCPGT